MKMDPNGSKPPATLIQFGVRNHGASGMGRGIALTRHGLSGAPFQLRPMTVPKSTSGKEMQDHMTNMTTIVPNGTAAKEW